MTEEQKRAAARERQRRKRQRDRAAAGKPPTAPKPTPAPVPAIPLAPVPPPEAPISEQLQRVKLAREQLELERAEGELVETKYVTARLLQVMRELVAEYDVLRAELEAAVKVEERPEVRRLVAASLDRYRARYEEAFAG